jgi:hypothetical protein
MNTLYQSNHFMQLVILTQNHVFQKEKYWWIAMFKMNYIMVKKHKINSKLNNYLFNIENYITQLLNSCICIYIICNTFLCDRM